MVLVTVEGLDQHLHALALGVLAQFTEAVGEDRTIVRFAAWRLERRQCVRVDAVGSRRDDT